jgi:hypothetical protein
MRPRFSFRREAAIGLGAYGVFLLVRRAVFHDHGRARAHANAERIVELERRLGLHLGPPFQKVLVPRRRLALCLNWAYVTLNVVLTVGSLAHLFRRKHPDYHRLRRAAALSMLGAQPVFLLVPTAPPRMLDGFVDTIAEHGGPDLDSGLVVKLYNPLAAMPSIHVAFAIVTGAGLAAAADGGVARTLAVAYPPAVAATVIATGNHYTLDCLAGAVLAAAALESARRMDW